MAPHDVIAAAAVALARRPDWLYLNNVLWQCRKRRAIDVSSRRWSRMVQPVSTPQPIPGTLPERRTAPAILVGVLVAGAAILLGTLVLWFHYGTAVFFEMIAAGFNACF